MYFKVYRPTTPSQRQLIRLENLDLEKKPLLKNKIFGKLKTTGKNNCGHTTVFTKGGGHKKRYREINFLKNVIIEGIVCSIEYDPNRNANIISVYEFAKKKFFYTIAPFDIKVGDIIKSGTKAEIKVGHSLPLSQIPIGNYIHNIFYKTNKYSQITRAAGTFAVLTEKNKNNVSIKLSSGKTIHTSSKCFATIGVVSNIADFLTKSGKAGHSRWLNKKPSVRGVAMNPVDHPNGGGEGKKSGFNKTPWGKIKKLQMSRSKWKGPFINEFEYKNTTINMSRKTEVFPNIIGSTKFIYNGYKTKEVTINEDMIGHKLGEFFLPE